MNRRLLLLAIALVVAVPLCWICFRAGQIAGQKKFDHYFLANDDLSLSQMLSELFHEAPVSAVESSKWKTPDFLPTLDDLDARRQAILSASSGDKKVEQYPQDIASLGAVLPDPLWHPALLAHPKPQRIGILSTAQTEDYDTTRLKAILSGFSSVERLDLAILKWPTDKEQEDKPGPNPSSFGYDNLLIEVHRFTVDDEQLESGSICSGLVRSFSLPVDLMLVEVSVSSFIDQKDLVECFEEVVGDDNIGADFMWIMEEPKQLAPDFRYDFVEKLASLGQRWTVTEYPFGSHRNYIVVQKPETQALWHRNEAEWNLLLKQKLQFPIAALMDSPLLLTMEYPSKESEVEFCRRNFEDPVCLMGGSGFNAELTNTPITQLYVAKSLQGKNAGRGVFAGRYIPADTYIGVENPESVWCPWTCFDTFSRLMEARPTPGLQSVLRYMHGYGVRVNQWGRPDVQVDSTLMCFANHGCDGTYNINQDSESFEFMIEFPSEEVIEKLAKGKLTSAEVEILQEMIPKDLIGEWTAVRYRPIRNADKVSSYALIDIEAGSELLDNYMLFAGIDAVDFWPYALSLKQECLGMEGVIEQWQDEKKPTKSKSSNILDRSQTECPLPLVHDGDLTQSTLACVAAVDLMA